MDDILGQLITVPNLVFCIFIALIVEGKNRLVSYFWPGAKNNKLYQDLGLPLAPLLVGALMAGLINTYPYPEMFSAFWPRIFLGSCFGLASAHVYRIGKKFLTKKEKEEGPDPEATKDTKESDPPVV